MTNSPDFVGCPPSTDVLVEAEINRVLTQYRESDKLLSVIRADLQQVAEAIQVACSIPDFFDLDTAVGHQLTLLGKRLGWPREHCFCRTHPVFGFPCEGEQSLYQISGFCVEGVRWSDCIDFGTGTVSIDDDETYRRFLKVRRYQFLALYDIDSLNACARIFFGPQALVLSTGNRRVVIAPGRTLTDYEAGLLPLYRRVLPVALGIDVYFHFRSVHPFGFGNGWGGFCDHGAVNELLVTESGAEFVTEEGAFIVSGSRQRNSEWLCPVKIEDCMNTSIYGPNGIHPEPEPVQFLYAETRETVSSDPLIFKNVPYWDEHHYREIMVVIAGKGPTTGDFPISSVFASGLECSFYEGIRAADGTFVGLARINLPMSARGDIVIDHIDAEVLAISVYRVANRNGLNTAPVQVVSDSAISAVSELVLSGIVFETDIDFALSAAVVAGSPTITMSEGSTINHTHFSGTYTIVFSYCEGVSVEYHLSPSATISAMAFNMRG